MLLRITAFWSWQLLTFESVFGVLDHFVELFLLLLLFLAVHGDGAFLSVDDGDVVGVFSAFGFAFFYVGAGGEVFEEVVFGWYLWGAWFSGFAFWVGADDGEVFTEVFVGVEWGAHFLSCWCGGTASYGELYLLGVLGCFVWGVAVGGVEFGASVETVVWVVFVDAYDVAGSATGCWFVGVGEV